jgi:diguanylate cyclase (GGDEF)-like protein
MDKITPDKEEAKTLQQELERTKMELGILYEISNAMRTTLRLEEILYIILTGVTAHIGLGFNRALLFLVNEKDALIEGKMGIGPETGEDANRVWTQIEQEKMGLDDLISAYKLSGKTLESGFNRQVENIKVSLSDKNENLLSLAALEGMPIHLTKETIQGFRHTPIVQLLKSDEVVLVPLKAKDKVVGIIAADNSITHKPVSKGDLRMLTMLANQAGLAIENSQLYEKTVRQSHTDSLTELWNHGYFQHLLQSEIEKAKITRQELCLIMLDIDDFKVYNDTLGHQQGDRILQELARLLKDQSRKMDFVCRYGGEEVAVILPATGRQEARLIAERLRMDIENQAFVREEILPQKKLTVSIGIASFPADGQNPSELIKACDNLLYEAKKQGKNRTCC